MVQLFSKYVLSVFLNAFKLELLRTSRGSSFHCLAAVIVNEFSKILVLELETRISYFPLLFLVLIASVPGHCLYFSFWF